MDILTPSQISRLRELFTSLSTPSYRPNHQEGEEPDRTITSLAMAQLIRQFGGAVTDFDVADMVAEIDVNENGGEGSLDFEEFVQLFCRYYPSSTSATTSAAASTDSSDPAQDSSSHSPTSSSSSSSSSSSAIHSSLSTVPAHGHGTIPLRADELFELKECFLAMDIDLDGFLNAKDLQLAFQAVGDEYDLPTIEEMIREIDSTGKGKVKLMDFLSALAP